MNKQYPGQRRTGPPTEPGFSQGFFFSILSQREFWFLAAVIYYRNRDCVPEPVFFSPSPKLDYTVSAIKIVQFCM